MSEFELIKKLTGLLNIKDKNVLTGFGDDCASVKINENIFLFTMDSQIENQHFLKNKIKPFQLGWKLISINVSDIVACGGIPKWGLITVAIPKNLDENWSIELYKGIRKALDFYKFDIIGGNTSASEKIFLDLALVGETERFVSRAGAKKGQKVFISGYTGLSRAGLELLLMDKTYYEDFEKRLIEKHLMPTARIDIQPEIQKYAKSCIDISDGLVGDLSHICEQSKVKINLFKEKLPVNEDLKAYCEKYNKDPIDYILYGGEDYELAFTTEETDSQKFENCFEIGVVEEGEGIYLNNKKIEEKGFEHL